MTSLAQLPLPLRKRTPKNKGDGGTNRQQRNEKKRGKKEKKGGKTETETVTEAVMRTRTPSSRITNGTYWGLRRAASLLEWPGSTAHR